MIRIPRKCLLIILAALLLSGCGKEQPAPSQPPGKLTGIIYNRSGSMEWGNDFYVSIQNGRIDAMKYFETEELDYIQARDLPLDADCWADIETTVAQLWPSLEEKEAPKKRPRLYCFWNGEPTILDGGDSTDLSLVWETGDGVVTIPYRWDNSDPLYYELAALLKALAPQ